MSTFKLAWRNIWRNQRRTGVTVAALTLALLFTLVYSSMMEGYIANMERDALGFEVGAAQIFAKGYQDKPSIYTHMEDSDALVRALDGKGIKATGRLLGAGLVAAGDASAGAQFRGIDVDRDPLVLEAYSQIAQGKWLDRADPAGVVLGVKLARTLGVKPGDELVLLGQATDGSIANELATVRGILRSIGEGTDRAGLFMTEAAFRRFMAFDGGAHQLIVRRPAGIELAALQIQLEAVASGRDVQTWRKLIPTLATMMDSARGMLAFMFFIINVATAIVILNAMLMAVFERIKEFGILKALGVGPSEVLRLIYAESLMQVGVAMVVGAALATPVLWYLSVYGINIASMAGVSAMGIALQSEWVAVVTVPSVLAPVMMMLVVVSIAVLYPALKAALIEPVHAIRHT